MKFLAFILLILLSCETKNNKIQTASNSTEEITTKPLSYNEDYKFPVKISFNYEDELFKIKNDSLYFNFVFRSHRCDSLNGYAFFKGDTIVIVHDNSNCPCERHFKSYNISGVVPHLYHEKTKYVIKVLHLGISTGNDIRKATQKFVKEVTFIKAE